MWYGIILFEIREEGAPLVKADLGQCILLLNEML